MVYYDEALDGASLILLFASMRIHNSKCGCYHKMLRIFNAHLDETLSCFHPIRIVHSFIYSFLHLRLKQSDYSTLYQKSV